MDERGPSSDHRAEIVWKTTQLQKDVEVHVHQHNKAELTRTFTDELTYQHYHFNPATDEALPLKWQAGNAMRTSACEGVQRAMHR